MVAKGGSPVNEPNTNPEPEIKNLIENGKKCI
jgi:hypothetical protein